MSFNSTREFQMFFHNSCKRHGNRKRKRLGTIVSVSEESVHKIFKLYNRARSFVHRIIHLINHKHNETSNDGKKLQNITRKTLFYSSKNEQIKC